MDPTHHNLEPFELSTIVEERTETASPTTSKISFRKDESFQSKDNNNKHHHKPSSATLYSNSRSNVVQKNQSQRSGKSGGVVNSSVSVMEDEGKDKDDENEKAESVDEETEKQDEEKEKDQDNQSDNSNSDKSNSNNSHSSNDPDQNTTVLTKNTKKDSKDTNSKDDKKSSKSQNNCNISMGQIEAGSRSPRSIPNDSIILKLMIVTGDSAEFIFSLKTPASTISEHIWNNWPSNWPDSQKTTKAETLRLIYQGRFLHGNVTLGALKLVPKAMTVMHLVHREKLPQAPVEEDDKKNGGNGNNGGSGNPSNRGSGRNGGEGEGNVFVRFLRSICCCGQ